MTEKRDGFAPGVGGDRRSAVIEAPADWLFARLSEALDTSLEEYRSALGERGLRVGVGTVWRFFDRHGINVKNIPRTQPSRIGRTSPKPG